MKTNILLKIMIKKLNGSASNIINNNSWLKLKRLAEAKSKGLKSGEKAISQSILSAIKAMRLKPIANHIAAYP